MSHFVVVLNGVDDIVLFAGADVLKDLELLEELEFKVESCNCISIIWSPNLIVKLSGDLPLKKSLTWVSFKDSSACITEFSGLWLCNEQSNSIKN